jgi:hypothetical protein
MADGCSNPMNKLKIMQLADELERIIPQIVQALKEVLGREQLS